MAPVLKASYDFVIVGAGSAGCVLANRLTADGDKQVLLLEAGPADNSMMLSVPGFFTTAYRTPGPFGWVYQTAPQQHVDKRVMRDIRGKTLGGSSSMNGMLYCRGAAADYDGWAAGNDGSPGWSYREILPYFKRLEDYEDGESTYHGADGPLYVGRSKLSHPLAKAFVEAAQEAGHPYSEDINGAQREGFGPSHFTIKKGRRWSAAVGYLRPALKRPNLTVATGAQATRIMLDKARATGIEFVQNGRKQSVSAGEVILSGGAFQSPHLLMVSGIGAGDPLKKIGVSPRVDLPGVGKNLHDHGSITAQADCTAPITYARLNDPFFLGKELMRYAFQREGLMAECTIEAVGMFKGMADSVIPDIKCQFVPIRLDLKTGMPLPQHGMINRMELTVPDSRGELRLASADPLAAPIIDVNYLAAERDVVRLRNAMRVAMEIFRQPAFKEFGVTPVIPVDFDKDQTLDAYIRQTLTNDHHAAGTCAMGNGPDAVVDPQLRVHGVDGLRVVDCSIMPKVVSGNTNAPTMMIAEKASDMILGKTPLPAAQL